jgi:catechol 2,3-dioxygenase-like lactoylglutathione lyase family enzyme
MGTMYRLKCGNSSFKLIDPKKVPPAGASGMPAQLGYRYVTFTVKNLSEICGALKDKGTKFTIEEMELRPGVRIAMVKDPDGNTVEFVQRSE